MIIRERKTQKDKILKREKRLSQDVKELANKEKVTMDLIDAANSASFTDGVESFDYKLNYDFED
ncbi:MAG: hypothetical protein S4CHLAM6_08950 [Chlamydiae bacterium]|nr:hypothetical protein [Chlamydiota bacterium]